MLSGTSGATMRAVPPDEDGRVPGCHSQQRIDHGEVHSITLELLNERRLVKGDTSRDRLADDALAFGQQLRSQPAETTFFVSHRQRSRVLWTGTYKSQMIV